MKPKLIIRLLLLVLGIHFTSCAQNGKGSVLLNADTFEQKLKDASGKSVLDVRTPEEFATGHINGAQNINFYDDNFMTQVAALDKSKPVFVYCKAGSRSAKAASMMAQAGFKEIYDLDGGMMAWGNANKPVVMDAPEKPDTYYQADFDKLINGGKPVLVDFFATWCVPCMKMAPSLEKLKQQYEGQVVVQRIDVDEAKALAKLMGIETLPAFVLYKNGKEVKRVQGYMEDAALVQMIESLK